MKTNATLLALFVAILFTSTSKAQISEGFETSTLADLTANCWSFSGASRVDNNTSTAMTGAYTLQVVPATSASNTGNSNTGQVITPYLDLGAASTLSFNYRLTGTGGSRYAQIRFYDQATGFSQPLQTITLSATTKTAVSISIPAGSGYKKLIIDIVGSGGGNVWEYLDDITASAPKATTTNCNVSFSSPLPVKLVSFSGNIFNSKAQLTWSVAENETGDHFEIEKSTDGRTFANAGVLFTTTKIGTESYSFREAAELTTTSYYRLKIVNKDNSTSYSKIVTLKTDKDAATTTLTIVQNPVTATLQFQYTAATTSTAKVILYNAAGVSVMSKDLSLQKGTNAVSLNLDNSINQGTYFLQISNGTERSIAKLVKK